MTTGERTLVTGGAGFLGGHVVRALLEAGREVRVLVRATTDLAALDGLEVERALGDLTDRASVERALDGCAVLYQCAIDTRAWLRDPTPLYRTNVDGVRTTLEAAARAARLRRVVLTSSMVTVGGPRLTVSTEDDPFDWGDAVPHYVRSRVLAERVATDAAERGLDVVVVNPSTTVGDHDHRPTPQGRLIRDLTRGRVPGWYDAGLDVVGVRDVARAMLVAEARGRSGARYLLTGRHVTLGDVVARVSRMAGRRAPRLHVPPRAMDAGVAIAEAWARLRGRDTVVTRDSLALSRMAVRYDPVRARDELGWRPRPVEEVLAEAVRWFQDRDRASKAAGSG